VGQVHAIAPAALRGERGERVCRTKKGMPSDRHK